MPCDLEAELSILATIADHPGTDPRLPYSWVTAEHFYDRRHMRLLRHVRGETLRVPVSEEDLAYLENARQYAWPITKGSLASFIECYERRARLLEIETERAALLA